MALPTICGVNKLTSTKHTKSALVDVLIRFPDGMIHRLACTSLRDPDGATVLVGGRAERAWVDSREHSSQELCEERAIQYPFRARKLKLE